MKGCYLYRGVRSRFINLITFHHNPTLLSSPTTSDHPLTTIIITIIASYHPITVQNPTSLFSIPITTHHLSSPMATTYTLLPHNHHQCSLITTTHLHHHSSLPIINYHSLSQTISTPRSHHHPISYHHPSSPLPVITTHYHYHPQHRPPPPITSITTVHYQ